MNVPNSLADQRLIYHFEVDIHDLTDLEVRDLEYYISSHLSLFLQKLNEGLIGRQSKAKIELQI